MDSLPATQQTSTEDAPVEGCDEDEEAEGYKVWKSLDPKLKEALKIMSVAKKDNQEDLETGDEAELDETNESLEEETETTCSKKYALTLTNCIQMIICVYIALGLIIAFAGKNQGV